MAHNYHHHHHQYFKPQNIYDQLKNQDPHRVPPHLHHLVSQHQQQHQQQQPASGLVQQRIQTFQQQGPQQSHIPQYSHQQVSYPHQHHHQQHPYQQPVYPPFSHPIHGRPLPPDPLKSASLNSTRSQSPSRPLPPPTTRPRSQTQSNVIVPPQNPPPQNPTWRSRTPSPVKPSSSLPVSGPPQTWPSPTSGPVNSAPHPQLTPPRDTNLDPTVLVDDEPARRGRSSPPKFSVVPVSANHLTSTTSSPSPGSSPSSSPKRDSVMRKLAEAKAALAGDHPLTKPAPFAARSTPPLNPNPNPLPPPSASPPKPKPLWKKTLPDVLPPLLPTPPPPQRRSHAPHAPAVLSPHAHHVAPPPPGTHQAVPLPPGTHQVIPPPLGTQQVIPPPTHQAAAPPPGHQFASPPHGQIIPPLPGHQIVPPPQHTQKALPPAAPSPKANRHTFVLRHPVTSDTQVNLWNQPRPSQKPSNDDDDDDDNDGDKDEVEKEGEEEEEDGDDESEYTYEYYYSDEDEPIPKDSLPPGFPHPAPPTKKMMMATADQTKAITTTITTVTTSQAQKKAKAPSQLGEKKVKEGKKEMAPPLPRRQLASATATGAALSPASSPPRSPQYGIRDLPVRASQFSNGRSPDSTSARFVFPPPGPLPQLPPMVRGNGVFPPPGGGGSGHNKHTLREMEEKYGAGEGLDLQKRAEKGGRGRGQSLTMRFAADVGPGKGRGRRGGEGMWMRGGGGRGGVVKFEAVNLDEDALPPRSMFSLRETETETGRGRARARARNPSPEWEEPSTPRQRPQSQIHARERESVWEREKKWPQSLFYEAKEVKREESPQAYQENTTTMKRREPPYGYEDTAYQQQRQQRYQQHESMSPPITQISIESPTPRKLADIEMMENEGGRGRGDMGPIITVMEDEPDSRHESVSGVPKMNVEGLPAQRESRPHGGVPMIHVQGDDDDDDDDDYNPRPGVPPIRVSGEDGSPRQRSGGGGGGGGRAPQINVFEVPGISIGGGFDDSPGGGVGRRPSQRHTANAKADLGNSSGVRGSKRGGLICGGCGDSIIGRIVNAMGQRWHPGCFRCNVCDELLEHVSSYEWGGKPYCHLDYHENFAPRCYHCKTPIIEERFISLDDPALGKRTYHEQHFFCAECGDPFLTPTIGEPGRTGELSVTCDGEYAASDDVGFTVYRGHPYCEACHVRLRMPKCKKCKRSIRDGDRAVEALGGKWCWKCFVCKGCQLPFEDPSFFQRGNDPFCETCFSIILRNEI